MDGTTEVIRAIGLSVRDHRERQGMTQEALAEALGMDAGWVAALEAGDVDIRAREALDVSQALGVPFDALMSLDGYLEQVRA